LPQKSQQEFEIITANNGEEGLVFFEMNFSQVRLVFTDFEMPGISGPQMSAKMRYFEKE
jgi:YesN/AraC family two-component response regulator